MGSFDIFEVRSIERPSAYTARRTACPLHCNDARMTPKLPQLRVQALDFAYPDRPLWSAWHAIFGPGVALAEGGDGAGKTSLLRLLAGQLKAQGGQIALQLAGTAPPLLAPGEAYRRQVAWFDPRQPALPNVGGLTPQAWLDALPARHPAWCAEALQAHVAGWALAPHLGKPFDALSTGTRRKVFMAAALASGAPLTLIDEPVSGLDRPSIAYLQQALDGLVGRPDRIVIVAHHEALPGVRWQDVVRWPD